jgi:hypothetical protein
MLSPDDAYQHRCAEELAILRHPTTILITVLDRYGVTRRNFRGRRKAADSDENPQSEIAAMRTNEPSGFVVPKPPEFVCISHDALRSRAR